MQESDYEMTEEQRQAMLRGWKQLMVISFVVAIIIMMGIVLASL